MRLPPLPCPKACCLGEGREGMEVCGRWREDEGRKFVEHACSMFLTPFNHLRSVLDFSGLAQCAELCWQLRGLAGRRQVPGAKVALQHNLGIGGAVVVTLYGMGFPGAARWERAPRGFIRRGGPIPLRNGLPGGAVGQWRVCPLRVADFWRRKEALCAVKDLTKRSPFGPCLYRARKRTAERKSTFGVRGQVLAMLPWETFTGVQ